MNKFRLLLADDDKLVRQGTASLLEKNGITSVIYEAGNGHEAIQLLQQHTVDGVLLDIRMPGKTGIEVLREIKKSFPKTFVIAVTGFDGTELILNLLQEGVHGFVQKTNGVEEVLKALNIVATGGRYFSEVVMQAIHAHADQWEIVPPVNFRAQELKLLKAIAEGLTTKEIADRYCLSIRTAETNRQRLLRRTQSLNTAGLIAYAYRNGII
jgi:two-component system response regulator DegU